MASLGALASEVEDFIIAKVRKEHPFMEINSVHDLARELANALRTGIKKRLPQSEDSKDRFDFFVLPPELRNRIYDLILVRRKKGVKSRGKQEAINVDIHDETEMQMERFFRKEPTGEQPAITKVCRRMREETLPVYYGSNRFITFIPISRRGCGGVIISDSIGIGACQWFRCIGNKNTALIKDFIVVHWGSSSPSASKIASVKSHLEASGIQLPQVTKHMTYDAVHRMDVEENEDT